MNDLEKQYIASLKELIEFYVFCLNRYSTILSIPQEKIATGEELCQKVKSFESELWLNS